MIRFNTLNLASAVVATLATTLLLTDAAFGAPVPEFSFTDSADVDEGTVVVFMAPDAAMGAVGKDVDATTQSRLSETLKRHDFKGDFGEVMTFKALAPFDNVVVIGTGSEALSQRQLADLGGHAAVNSEGDVSVVADSIETDVATAGAYIAQGYALRSYNFDRYKFETDANAKAEAVTIIVGEDDDESGDRYANDLAHIVEGVYLTRDLGTEPGNKMWPQAFVERVQPHFNGVANIKLSSLNLRALERENMGAIVGVGKGSVHDPRMMVIEYNGDPDGSAPIALVGKGITFDTGGISLKPNSGMWYMKSDLSGAAAVAGAILAAAKRGERVNIVGLMPLAENMPASDAIRPGDVLTTMGGKTIEVMSTDAEGRLLLIDAVQYAQEKFDPDVLVTIATLTGSAARAMGDDYAVVMSRDFDASAAMMKIGDTAGEDVWPLPLNDNHFKAIKSDIADIKSTAGNPGASIGGAVIGTFIEEDQPWIHLDIAGVDWLDKARATTPKGHAGWGVRFMDQMLRESAVD